MFENTSNSRSINTDLGEEASWNHLYSTLRSRARYLVYSFVLPSWRGQEEDIIEDIVQETLRRLIERAQKSERGEAPPIQSAEHIMMIIAQNYCIDLRRQDRRVFRIIPSDHSAEFHQNTSEQAHPFDSGTENVYQEKLFELAAREIANFPDKQRTALLIDLANRMSFDTHVTPLQKAFLSNRNTTPAIPAALTIKPTRAYETSLTS